MPEIYDFSAHTADGRDSRTGACRGQVMLIVNTASKCGFTPQYEGLQALYRDYQPKGLAVLGFPCDQFMHQEPGNDAEIQTFCTTKYDVTFPVFSKIDVNGSKAHPLWTFLKSEKSGLLGGGIKWNFTKFLVDRAGRVIGRYPPTATPASLKSDIEKALAAA
jgi:glutathione peroxidase